MKRQNKILKDNTKLQTGMNGCVIADTASLTASFTSDVGPYASLQNITSSVRTMSSSRSESRDPRLNNAEYRNKGVDSYHNPLISRIRHGSIRRCSFSAREIHKSVIPPHKRYSRLTPAKSYPNPLYMKTLKNIDGLEPPVVE